MDYPVTLERQSADRIRVSFPDFPEAQLEAKDEAEGLQRAQHVLAGAIDGCIRTRRAVPVPSRVTSHHVPVPALIEAKIKLYEAMGTEQVGKAELARRLGWHLPQVDRLFDVNHGSRLEQLETAFAALGKRLVLDVLDEPGRSQPPVRNAGRGVRSEKTPQPGTGAPPFEAQWD